MGLVLWWLPQQHAVTGQLPFARYRPLPRFEFLGFFLPGALVCSNGGGSLSQKVSFGGVHRPEDSVDLDLNRVCEPKRKGKRKRYYSSYLVSPFACPPELLLLSCRFRRIGLRLSLCVSRPPAAAARRHPNGNERSHRRHGSREYKVYARNPISLVSPQRLNRTEGQLIARPRSRIPHRSHARAPERAHGGKVPSNVAQTG